MESKQRSENRAEVETSFALPKTLKAQTEIMPFGGAKIAMYAIYGSDMTDRKIWCCTFVDMDEAQAWVQASKAYGRAVKGAVLAQQEKTDGEAKDVAQDPAGSAAGRDPLIKLN